MAKFTVQMFDGTTAVPIPKVTDISVEARFPISNFTATVRSPNDTWRARLEPAGANSKYGHGHLPINRVRILNGSTNVLGSNRYFFLESYRRSGRDYIINGRSAEALLTDPRILPESNFSRTNTDDNTIIDAMLTNFVDMSGFKHSTQHVANATATHITKLEADGESVANRMDLINQTTGLEWFITLIDDSGTLKWKVNSGDPTTNTSEYTNNTTSGSPHSTILRSNQHFVMPDFESGMFDGTNRIRIVGSGTNLQDLSAIESDIVTLESQAISLDSSGDPTGDMDFSNADVSGATGLLHIEAKETAGAATSESVTWTTAFDATPVVTTSIVTNQNRDSAVVSRSTTGATLRNETDNLVKMAIAMEGT